MNNNLKSVTDNDGKITFIYREKKILIDLLYISKLRICLGNWLYQLQVNITTLRESSWICGK
jgi:hypothetical protein